VEKTGGGDDLKRGMKDREELALRKEPGEDTQTGAWVDRTGGSVKKTWNTDSQVYRAQKSNEPSVTGDNFGEGDHVMALVPSEK